MKKFLSIIVTLTLLLTLTAPALADVPELSVMWNGEYITFPDARPTLKNDRTMIPIRAFMEYTGAEVDYVDGYVILALPDGGVISFLPGELTAKYKTGDETASINMDSAPYIDENYDRTYVPLRFFTEALGYDVMWDGAENTAIVLDREAIAAKIDESFTKLNSVINAELEAAADGAEITLTITGTVTAEESETEDFSAEINALVRAGVYELTAETDAEALYPVLKPIFEKLGLGEGAATLPGGVAELPAYESFTVGSLLFDLITQSGAGINAYKYTLEAAQSCAEVVGDGCFEGEKLTANLMKLAAFAQLEGLSELTVAMETGEGETRAEVSVALNGIRAFVSITETVTPPALKSENF